MITDLHLGVLQGGMSGIARLTAGALLAGLWQGTLLCGVAGLILKLVPKSTATLRFVVWSAVFGVAVAMPFINLPGAAFAGRAGSVARSHVMLDLRWSYVLAGLWLVAATFRLVQLLLQGVGLRALWSSAVPLRSERLKDLDVRLRVNGRQVELCTSVEVDRPSVIGFFAPRILIPEWLLEKLTRVELNHIVLHELEHLRRRDDWVNLLQKVGLVLLPLNPALFWIDRRLSTERELACDDGVLERTQMPRAYAASLASIAERRLDIRRHGRFGALALAATGLRRRSELGERIESILGSRRPVNRGFAAGMAGILIVGVVGAGAGLAHAPRLVSFEAGPVNQAAFRPAVYAPREAMPSAVAGSTSAKFENASFHKPAKVRTKIVRTVVRQPAAASRVQQTSQNAAMPKQQFVVLTSWESSQVSRVVVQTLDGSFFIAPYAAEPTQAGWLIVQL